jgi:MOSC domain-containing protein YiiM
MLPSADSDLYRLMSAFPRAGTVRWIGLRPKRDVPMREVEAAEVKAGGGLVGDRYAGGSGKRGITLIQAEHLPVIGALAGLDAIAPATLRRNVLVAGIPLIALKGRRFRIGSAVFEGTEPCDPCSRMEAALGPGGYNAMRGHGGLCARVVESGRFALGDAIEFLGDADTDTDTEATGKRGGRVGLFDGAA